MKHSAVITGDTLVKTGAAKLFGIAITVTTATAEIDIRDGIAAGGGSVVVRIPSGTSGVVMMPSGNGTGVHMQNGIFVDYAATATGSVVVIYE